jgi:hypothetical protein
MHDNAFAAKRFRRNTAQQGVSKHCINFQILGSKKLAAMQQKELGKRSSIFRSFNELEDQSVGCIPRACPFSLALSLLMQQVEFVRFRHL